MLNDHDIMEFNVTEEGKYLVGYARCSCGKEFRVKMVRYKNTAYEVDTTHNLLRSLCNIHLPDKKREEENTKKECCSHSYQYVSKELQTGSDPSYLVRYSCTKCGQGDSEYIRPVSALPSENPGDENCDHEMVFNFELDREPEKSGERRGFKQFFRCTKCSKTEWDIEYHS